MRFKGLDLNLLVAFDALVELRSVSRTGERLGLSQPAVSAALARLREYFGDELLVVDGKRMHPTPFAETLIPHVRTCLNAADTVVATSATFDPSTAIRTFRIISSDYVLAAVLARVARRLATLAPRVRLEFVLPDEVAEERFVRGELDLLIAPATFLVDSHPSDLLYEESHVLVGWKDNPIFTGEITPEQVFAAGHVAVSMGPHREVTFGDRQMEQINPDRRIEAVVSSFTMIPWLVVGTQRLALMHRRLAVAMAESLPIAFAPLPFPFPSMPEMMQYHRTRSADEGLRWLIEEIRRAAHDSGP
jgi:LysR family transcriptional regulator, nod-box dependent transcriptional activator